MNFFFLFIHLDELIAKAESSQRNASNTFNQRYNEPQQHQQQKWFPMQNQPQSFVPIQTSFQKENSAFAQFNSGFFQSKPYPNLQYNQMETNQDFYSASNKPVRHPKSYNQAQESYSPQKQQNYQNGSNVEILNRRVPSFPKTNDFMPSFSSGASSSQNRRESKPQEQLHSQVRLSI